MGHLSYFKLCANFRFVLGFMTFTFLFSPLFAKLWLVKQRPLECVCVCVYVQSCSIKAMVKRMQGKT